MHIISGEDVAQWLYLLAILGLCSIPCIGGVKQQWACRQLQFSVFSLAVSSETLEIRTAFLHRDTETLVGFPMIPKCMTLNDPEWPFYVKLFTKFKFKIYLLTCTDSAMISMGHIYACGMLDVSVIDIFMYIYDLSSSHVNVFQQMQAYCLSAQYN